MSLIHAARQYTLNHQDKSNYIAPMVKNLLLTIFFAAGALLFTSRAQAARETAAIQTTDSISDNGFERESLVPRSTLSLAFSHFTWGAEAGSSLDMTSHDLSTFDADVLIGFKNSFIKIVGFGAGLHRSIHSGNNMIPVYAVFRSSFRSKPSLCFLNLQAGYSFNTYGDSKTMSDLYGALGLGINLQKTSKASSYVILSLACQHLNDKNKEAVKFDTNYILFAKLMIGVTF